MASIKPAINIYEGNYYDALLPKEKCSECNYLPGCYGAAVSCITNELGIEFRDYFKDLKTIEDRRKFLPG